MASFGSIKKFISRVGFMAALIIASSPLKSFAQVSVSTENITQNADGGAFKPKDCGSEIVEIDRVNCEVKLAELAKKNYNLSIISAREKINALPESKELKSVLIKQVNYLTLIWSKAILAQCQFENNISLGSGGAYAEQLCIVRLYDQRTKELNDLLVSY